MVKCLTEAQKDSIVKQYGEYKKAFPDTPRVEITTSLGEEFNVNERTIRNVLEERREIITKRRNTNIKTCTKCGNTALTAKSKYCHICGARLKTQSEIAFIKLQKAIGGITVPAQLSACVDALNEYARTIKEGNKND